MVRAFSTTRGLCSSGHRREYILAPSNDIEQRAGRQHIVSGLGDHGRGIEIRTILGNCRKVSLV